MSTKMLNQLPDTPLFTHPNGDSCQPFLRLHCVVNASCQTQKTRQSVDEKQQALNTCIYAQACMTPVSTRHANRLARMYARARTHTHVSKYAGTHTNTDTHTRVRIHTHKKACTHMCVQIRTHAGMHAHTQTLTPPKKNNKKPPNQTRDR